MAALAIRLALAALLWTAPSGAWAQSTDQPPPAGQKILTAPELQQLVAPIALYPDNLLAQLLMASTYPLEIVEAARWAQGHRSLTGPALEQALLQQSWDPSVKSLVTVPQVLKMMNDQLDWTQRLGDAFLAQQADVLQAVQSLRGRAQNTGSLRSTSQQSVSVSQAGGASYVTIQPTDPQMIYVPSYSPATVYGAWPYPSLPPYALPPAPAVFGAGAPLAFGAGVATGAAMWGACNWRAGSVAINTNQFNNFNHTNIVTPDWRHNPEHRRGVPYANDDLARRFGRGGINPSAREEFRGRAQAGQPLFANQPYKPRDLAGRDLAGRNLAGPGAGEAREHAFEGIGRGEEVRRQSERGRASRGRMLESRPRVEHFAPAGRGGMHFAGQGRRFGGRRR